MRGDGVATAATGAAAAAVAARAGAGAAAERLPETSSDAVDKGVSS